MPKQKICKLCRIPDKLAIVVFGRGQKWRPLKVSNWSTDGSGKWITKSGKPGTDPPLSAAVIATSGDVRKTPDGLLCQFCRGQLALKRREQGVLFK